MKKIRDTIFINCILLLLLCTTLCACQKVKSNDPIATHSEIAFDTIISISIYDNSSNNLLSYDDAKSYISHSVDICKKYENMLSKSVTKSDIYQINHANNKPISVENDTYYLIEKSIHYSQITDGLIDITVSKAKDLWDFSSDNLLSNSGVIPDPHNIYDALNHVDYKNIILDAQNHTILLNDNDAEIDLGFIAKGYIADQIKDYLLSVGVENAIINLGGNVITIGTKPNGDLFSVGIKKPFTENDFEKTIKVSNKSVVTSGVYERCFKINDTLYHHIIDPTTGYPIKTDLLSATIVAESSMECDALSTICILKGQNDAIQFIKEQHNVTAYLITDDYELIEVSSEH